MRTPNRLLVGLTALVAFTYIHALSPRDSLAQIRVNQYTATTPNLGWTDISSGATRIYPNSGGQLWYWSTASMSLPFNFVFDGHTFSAGTFLGMKAGCIQFGGTPSYGINYDGLGNSSYPNRLIYWGGYYVTSGLNYYWGADSSYYALYYKVTGSAGSRVLTIQFPYMHTNWGSGGFGDVSQAQTSGMQVKLYEGTNVIQFIYQTHNKYLGGFYAEGIGLNGGTTGGFRSLSSYTGVTSTPSTDLQYAPCSAPSITSNPTDVTVCSGETATFSVSAAGTGLSYQWRKGGNSISGATSSTYSIANTSTGDNGSYDVVVSSSCGTVTSDSASLTVQEPPSIAADPSDETVCTGRTATFSVSASGTGLSYQWRKDGTAISGATSSTYSIASSSTTDNGSYDVVITGTCGTATSNSASLTVQPPPSISVSVSPSTIWPANHQMVTVDASVTTSGGCTLCGPLSVELVSITCNESLGTNDIQNASTGTDDRSVSLRAERAGNGTGRIYTLTYRVTDCNGGTATASAMATVPHDNGGTKLPSGEEAFTIAKPFEMSIHPNPASSKTTISVNELPGSLSTVIEVIDQMGRRVALLYDAIPDGDIGFSRDLNTSELLPGTYFIRVTNAIMERSMKMEIIR